jgi:acyl dehydratase
MATTVNGISGLKEKVGEHLGYSDWVEITQEQVNLFADATGDHQWIHVDPVRAAAGPFGGPIAHGYLTLSLSNALLPEVVEVEGVSLGVNYGTGKVRFPAPVAVGARLRAQVTLASVEDVPGGIQTTMMITMEVEGSDKPACVIESISRYLA